MKYQFTLGCLFLLVSSIYAQDTIRLKRKPHVILKSWHPEYKDFPNLILGENKILFTLIPDFKNLSIRDNDINLVAKNGDIVIKETEKPNQYLITVHNVDTSYLELEVWFDLGTSIILLKKNTKWELIKDSYPLKDNRIMLETLRLKVTK